MTSLNLQRFRMLALTALVLGAGCDDEKDKKKPAAGAKAKPPANNRAYDGGEAGGEAGGGLGADIDPAQLLARVKPILQALPKDAPNPDNPTSEAKVALGRMLYFDARLSKNHDVSCNTCHDLATYGVDPRTKDGALTATSAGHKGQMGPRNSPTVYNAALHFVQFWDGRAKDVEEQAKGPVLNPIEMAMKDEAAVVATLKSIPGLCRPVQGRVSPMMPTRSPTTTWPKPSVPLSASC